MKLSRRAFLEQERKAVTLMGMSGVGKSHISSKLEDWGWHNYSCDYLIATKYLSGKVEGAVCAENIVNLSAFVGQVGDKAQGGVNLAEFRRRQKIYYDAECAVLRDMPSVLKSVKTHFVNDSSGSLCEVEDRDILDAVGHATLFVYLKADDSDHKKILERAVSYPKPLYFPPTFFSAYVKKFEAESGQKIEDAAPEKFLGWVFPHLFAARLPKYQALADQYGVTIPAHAFDDIKSADDFTNVIAEHLP